MSEEKKDHEEEGQEKPTPVVDDLKSEMTFDSDDPIEVKITIKDEQYVLVQCSEYVCENYRNEVVARATKAESGKTPKDGEGIGNLPTFLLSKCLFKINPANGARKKLDPSVIQVLPGKIVKKIFERAQRISGLEQRPTTLPELKKLRAEIDLKIKELEEEEARLGES